MGKDLVIGLDCSTSACKAIVWDREGRPISEGRAPLPMLTPRPSWHEQPAEAWWEAACSAISRAAEQIEPDRLAAICIANQRESFVPVDIGGKPLRSAILWMDGRASGFLKPLAEIYGAERFREISGKTLSGNLTLCKLAWLRENEPEVFRAAYKFLDVQAFLAHRLTGGFRTGWGSADPTGLFDMRTDSWSGEILGGIGLGIEKMPEALPPGTILGELGAEAAAACRLPRGIPLAAGLGDGQSACLGVDISESGESSLSLGTSIVSGTYSVKFLTDAAFRTSYGGLPGSYILETVILGGAYTVNWFVDKFRDSSGAGAESELEALAREIPAGAEGLLLVPYWTGAMNPYWDPGASGITVGWRGHHGRAHLYRAILEGAAFEQYLHASGVEKALGRPIERYLASGGGSKSDLWCRIIADVTGKPVHRVESPEAAALGAGILAAAAAGLFPGIPQAAKSMVRRRPRIFEPDRERHAFYLRLYEEVYVRLYPALRECLGRLADIVGEDPSSATFSPPPRPSESPRSNR